MMVHSQVAHFGRAARRGAGLAVALLLLMAALALAAAQFRPGALYTGKGSACGSTVPDTTCVFRFRASTDGRSLRSVGKTVIDTWGCRGGGGEALLGGKIKGATPIPVIKLRADGSLRGSVAYVFRPTSAPPEHITSTVTGHLSHAGKAAVITFRMTFHSSRSPCVTRPVTITASASGSGGSH
jgi:hypothetical protein